MWHYVGNYVDEYNAFFTSVKWDLYIFFSFFSIIPCLLSFLSHTRYRLVLVTDGRLPLTRRQLRRDVLRRGRRGGLDGDHGRGRGPRHRLVAHGRGLLERVVHVGEGNGLGPVPHHCVHDKCQHHHTTCDTMEEHSKYISVIELTCTRLFASLLPVNTRVVYHSTIYNGTWHITE